MTPESPTLPPEAGTGAESHKDTPPGVWGLRKALNASGMTREDFARRILGVTPSAVWRWLNGRPIPQTVQDRLTHYLTHKE